MKRKPNTIMMIKKVREITSTGLKEAKNFVEDVLADGWYDDTSGVRGPVISIMDKHNIDAKHIGKIYDVFYDDAYWTITDDDDKFKMDPPRTQAIPAQHPLMEKSRRTLVAEVERLRRVINADGITMSDQEGKLEQQRREISRLNATIGENSEYQATIERQRDTAQKELTHLQQRYCEVDYNYGQATLLSDKQRKEINQLNMQLRQERQLTHQLNDLVRELMRQRADTVWAEEQLAADLPF